MQNRRALRRRRPTLLAGPDEWAEQSTLASGREAEAAHMPAPRHAFVKIDLAAGQPRQQREIELTDFRFFIASSWNTQLSASIVGAPEMSLPVRAS